MCVARHETTTHNTFYTVNGGLYKFQQQCQTNSFPIDFGLEKEYLCA